MKSPRIKRRIIAKRDGDCCHYCGKKQHIHSMTVEHIIPQKRKFPNKHHIDNLVLACSNCNEFKDLLDKRNSIMYRLAGLRGSISLETNVKLKQKLKIT